MQLWEGEWDSGRKCSCSEEVALLQAKLAEVHGRLMAQIDICQQQQAHIIFLETSHTAPTKGKENQGRNWQESREGSDIKNELLQADLEAMRRRVLAEITQKNRLLEEMGDLKKRHRKEMAMEVSKFEGLEILYRKVMAQKGRELPQDLHVAPLLPNRQESDLARERQQLRKANGENKRLREAMAARQNEGRENRKGMKERRESENQESGGRGRSGGRSSQELREMGVLKEQISRINRGIKGREECVPLQMKLVGDRWGRRN